MNVVIFFQYKQFIIKSNLIIILLIIYASIIRTTLVLIFLNKQLSKSLRGIDKKPLANSLFPALCWSSERV